MYADMQTGAYTWKQACTQTHNSTDACCHGYISQINTAHVREGRDRVENEGCFYLHLEDGFTPKTRL